MEKIYNKLVRDRIPEIIESKGSTPYVRILDRSEFVSELKAKLVEEAEEVSKTENRQQLVEELADVKEVLNALYAAAEISESEVEQVRIEKAETRGGFDQRLMLEKVEEDPGA